MKFETNCSYYEEGEKALAKYPTFKKYPHEIVNGKLILEVKTLEELMEIIKEIQCPIIVGAGSDDSEKDGDLVIYDDYIE